MNELTLEEDDRVFVALGLGTLHGGVQVVGDSGEDLGDVLGEAVFQLVLVIAEHSVVLQQSANTKVVMNNVPFLWGLPHDFSGDVYTQPKHRSL